MNKYAIIVAGGSGSRMNMHLPKQFLMLRDRPVLWYPIETFLASFNDIRIILVLPEAFLGEGNRIAQSSSSPGSIALVTGGGTRFHSVKKGLEKVAAKSVVFVHDGVRCLLTSDLVKRCYETTMLKGNAIPAVSAVDTIRIETQAGSEMIDRTKIKIIQTPQTFLSDNLIKAYDQEYSDFFTDDASVAESAGEKIHLVEGEYSNIKITRSVDLMIAEQILKEREQ